MHKRKLTNSLKIYNIKLGFLIVTIFLGIFFRFYNIDNKVYWVDEACTSFGVSGYTEAEFMQEIGFNKLFQFKEIIKKYQRYNPQRSLFDTINSITKDEGAQLPPLYFILVRLVAIWINNPILASRGLSVTLSLITLVCIFWLCKELFKSSFAGWAATAIIAISPLHVLYAQEGRPYSLWILTITLSSASLLWALRQKRNFS